jgi:hypothetical protein
MKILVLFISFLLGTQIGRGADVAFSCRIMVMNREQIITVTRDTLDTIPRWREGDPNPPLSIREAIATARKEVERMDKHRHWALDSVTLRSIGSNDKWLYLVRFMEELGNGLPMNVDIPVLMNGIVLKPEPIVEHDHK